MFALPASPDGRHDRTLIQCTEIAEPMTANLEIAERVRDALRSADLNMYSELLDPNVLWGPADDPESGCHLHLDGPAPGRRWPQADVTEATGALGHLPALDTIRRITAFRPSLIGSSRVEERMIAG